MTLKHIKLEIKIFKIYNYNGLGLGMWKEWMSTIWPEGC